MVFVPVGEFIMGDDKYDDEKQKEGSIVKINLIFKRNRKLGNKSKGKNK